jgi:hypothetical protein
MTTTNVFSKSRIFKFLKRDCGTIPVAEIISGKIELFSKHQRFLIATESSKYLFSNTNILYCFHGAFELTPYVSHKIRFSLEDTSSIATYLIES